jgi:uncharacterized protein YndB with AHSA1/START domain/catechol 2,3-dioxygenase-like lactoylglutathione lyase family enzyme
MSDAPTTKQASNALGVTTFELTGDAGVRITRVVAAPKALVFDVHTRPEHLPKWMLGPPGWTMPVCEIDLRPGGAFRYVWRNGGAEAELTIVGTFQEVVRPDRLVATEAWVSDESGGEWPETHNTVTFTERDGRTTITTLIRYASPAARDAAVSSGMREGLDAGYAGLDAYLAGVALTMRLELVPVPVKDVDTAIAFYVGKIGFALDHDVQPGGGARVTQLTPPGSACSIVLYKDLPGLDLPPGTLRGLHLVVDDVRAAREVLLARGVDAGEVDDLGGILYVPFADPDGNTWLLQEIPAGSGRES